MNWFFPARSTRSTRSAHLEACIQVMLAEGALETTKIQLTQAAFRLQRRAADGGVAITFEQAFDVLLIRDQKGVFLRR